MTPFRILWCWLSVLACLGAGPNPEGCLHLAIASDPRSLDPHRLFSSEEGTLGALVFNTLYDSDRAGHLVPVLAAGPPRTTPDGLTHEIPIRRGIRFSNGDELTAEDVAFNLERMFDPRVNASPAEFAAIQGGLEFAQARVRESETPRTPTASANARWIEPTSVSGLEVADRYTLRIRTARADLALLKVVSRLFIGSRRLLANANPSVAARPIGTGTFVLREWRRGVSLRFERNPHYFRPEEPSPAAVEVMIGGDSATHAMMFERGEIDFQERLTDPDLLRYREDARFRSRLRTVPGATAGFIYLNCELPPFSDRRVRAALNHAVDREALVRVLSLRAIPARGPVAPVVRGAATDLPTYGFDPARARALLAEAGYPAGFDSQLWVVGESPRELKMALFVQASLREVGVRVELRPVSFPAYWDSIGRRGTVPMAMASWTPDYDDPRNPLSLFNADNISAESSMNACFYRNPRVQEWFHAADRETDPEGRLSLYRRIEHQVVEDAACLFLVHHPAEVMLQGRVRGFELGGFWPLVHFERCWLEP